MIRNLIRTSVAVLFLATPALAQQKSSTLTLGIDVSGMDRTARPQDDFFRYVNGAWADRTSIPAEMSTYGSFIDLRDQAAAALREIIETPAAQKNAQGTIAIEAIEAIEAVFIAPIAPIAPIASIASIAKKPAAYPR